MLLGNVFISTSRANYNAATGVTSSSNQTVLTKQIAHISTLASPTAWEQYKPLPEGILTSEFKIKVDPGVDIKEADTITAITLLDGVTPWPSANTAIETWTISYILPSTAGFLSYSMAYITRERAGGAV